MPRTNSMKQKPQDAEVLVAPRRAAEMLDVSRSEIDRIAARAGWARVYLSNARRGSIRFRLREVLQYIESRTVRAIHRSLPQGAMSDREGKSADVAPFSEFSQRP